MRLLVLGGSRFLGRAIVDEACSRGYDVTTFSRGRSGHHRPGTETLTGDRTNPEDLRQLARGEWDAVIDTSVLAPAHVAASARILAERTGHYTYISTVLRVRRVPAAAGHRELPPARLPARCHRHRGQPRLRPAQGRLRARGRRRVPGPVPHRPARPDRRAARERPVAVVVAAAARPGRDRARAGRAGQAGPDDRRQGPGGLGGRTTPGAACPPPSTCRGRRAPRSARCWPTARG